ncbi:MAG: antitoxin CptB, partial [Woeseiaceae bacterium]
MPNSKLRWQCRRGMRELDELLVSYLNEYYDESSENEKSAFHELL